MTKEEIKKRLEDEYDSIIRDLALNHSKNEVVTFDNDNDLEKVMKSLNYKELNILYLAKLIKDTFISDDELVMRNLKLASKVDKIISKGINTCDVGDNIYETLEYYTDRFTYDDYAVDPDEEILEIPDELDYE